MSTASVAAPNPLVTTALRMGIRAAFLVQLVLGVIFWTGHLDPLIPLHRVLGIALVLAVWAMAYIAARAGVNGRLVAVAVLWGLVAPILGLTQEGILPGSLHWTVQVLHLVVGFGLIGLAENMARRLPSGRLR
jgi:hypothetical protein